MSRDIKLVLCGLGLAFVVGAIWSVIESRNNATRQTDESIEELRRSIDRSKEVGQ